MTTQSNQERLRALRTLIGARLRSLREHKDLSQPDLADRANIGRSTVSLIETGERAPGADVIIQLVKALDTSADYLLGINPDPNPRPVTNDPILHHPLTPRLLTAFDALDDDDLRLTFVKIMELGARRQAEKREGSTET